MPGFGEQLRAFRETVEQRSRDVFVGSVVACKGSVAEGSEITGAPGQPVDSGFLLGSWDDEFVEDWRALLYTDVEYAPAIEEGQQEPYTTASGTEVTPRPMTLLSQVGGFHSVALTVDSFDLLVEDVANRVTGGVP